jgi:hypothetical protein
MGYFITHFITEFYTKFQTSLHCEPDLVIQHNPHQVQNEHILYPPHHQQQKQQILNHPSFITNNHGPHRATEDLTGQASVGEINEFSAGMLVSSGQLGNGHNVRSFITVFLTMDL